jgi:hypothetical protein
LNRAQKLNRAHDIIQRELMRQNVAKFHNVPDALRAYNSGWNPEKWNNPETNGYVADIINENAAAVSRLRGFRHEIQAPCDGWAPCCL